MANGIPVSYFAYLGGSANYVSKSLKCNHVIALSLQRSLITKNRFQMKKIDMPIGNLSTDKEEPDWILGAKWANLPFK